jgi:hypothetical protein
LLKILGDKCRSHTPLPSQKDTFFLWDTKFCRINISKYLLDFGKSTFMVWLILCFWAWLCNSFSKIYLKLCSILQNLGRCYYHIEFFIGWIFHVFGEFTKKKRCVQWFVCKIKILNFIINIFWSFIMQDDKKLKIKWKFITDGVFVLGKWNSSWMIEIAQECNVDCATQRTFILKAQWGVLWGVN